MKSMLYVGASLMIGASIYGFVDYKQTQNKQGFTQMYNEPKPEKVVTVIPVTVTEEKKTEPSKTTVAVTNKKAAIKKQDAPEVAPVVKPIAENEKIETIDLKIEEAKVEVEPKPTTTVKKSKKKKKLDHKIFSRAPLRDEIEEEVPVAKKEKSVVKDQ